MIDEVDIQSSVRGIVRRWLHDHDGLMAVVDALQSIINDPDARPSDRIAACREYVALVKIGLDVVRLDRLNAGDPTARIEIVDRTVPNKEAFERMCAWLDEERSRMLTNGHLNGDGATY